MGFRLLALIFAFEAQALLILDYQFSKNFGEIFYDYSGFGNHGQNGESLSADFSNTLPTDRGAYFSNSLRNYVLLPPNLVVSSSLQLGNYFSITMWCMSTGPSSIILTKRISNTGYFFTIERIISGFVFHVKDKIPGFGSGWKLGTEIIPLSKKYLDKWIFLSFINTDSIFNFYVDGVLSLSINQIVSYSESGLYSHYIGYTSSSIEGFVWNYQIYNNSISNSDFYLNTYTGSNCIVNLCSSFCSPAIKIDQVPYCISVNVKPSSDGKSTQCPSLCSNNFGCISDTCLDCSSCSSSSCEFIDNTVVCLCFGGVPTSTGCECPINKYYNAKTFTCENCYEECESCSENSKCLTCKATYSEPDINLGCVCTNGYHNTTALIMNGTCTKCNQDCKTCESVNQCIECSDPYATPILGSCECIQGYYNGSLGCTKCSLECLTCTNSLACDTCIANNSLPNNMSGCTCNLGYYNTSNLIAIDSCIKCNEDCLSCDSSLHCLSCIANNSVPDLTQGCICKEGYFNTSQLIQTDSCIPCSSECLSCSSYSQCTKCSSPLGILNLSGECICPDSYYKSQTSSCEKCFDDCSTCNSYPQCTQCYDLLSILMDDGQCICPNSYYKSQTGYCEKCHEDCLTCNSATECIACKDPNSVSSVSLCSCIEGFYNSSSSSELICSKCQDICSECINYNMCSGCTYKTMNIIDGLCSCPDRSELINETCVCEEGYTLIQNKKNIFECKQCSPACKTCMGIGSNNCILCSPDHIKVGNSCMRCNQGQFLANNSCINCSEGCQKCLNLTSCIQCKDSYSILHNETCIKNCSIGYFLNASKCDPCPQLCTQCNGTCIECKKNAEIFEDVCKCSKGFNNSENECVDVYFYSNLSISKKNLILISFNEPTETNLTINDFKFWANKELVADSGVFKIILLKVKKNSEYLFSLGSKSKILNGWKLKVEITRKVLFSASGSKLFKYTQKGLLTETFSPRSSYDFLLNLTQVNAKIIVSSSLGIAIVSNPGPTWSLLNTIQIISYLPLNSNKLTPNLVKFLKEFSTYNIIPNYIQLLFDQNATSDPYLESRNYGINTSVFFLNFGSNLLVFTFFIAIWPFVALVSRLGKEKISKKILKFSNNYKYNFFIRYWMLMYLEIGIYSLIQLRSKVLIQSQGNFNQVSAGFCIALFLLTPHFLLVFSYLSKTEILQKSPAFFTKYGSLYEEFKLNKGFWSCQFYFFSSIRKLFYVFSQVYLNNYLFLQGAANIFFSLMILVYLLCFLPFKRTSEMLSALFGEICATLVIILSYVYLFDIGIENRRLLELSTIFVVITGIGLQLLISFHSFCKQILNFLYKFEKARAMEIVDNAKRTIPELFEESEQIDQVKNKDVEIKEIVE